MPTNLEVIQSLYAAFARGDGPAAFALMDPAMSGMKPKISLRRTQLYVGPAPLARASFSASPPKWNNFQATPNQILDAGNIIGLGRYTATHNATGEPLNAQFAHVFGFTDGKVTSFQQYTDTAQATGATQP